jgi:uncharacterized RDD family membrane protein YckC
VSASPPPSAADRAAPGLALRVAAMIYESVLLFGVVFGAAFALLALTGWTYPLPDARRWVLQGVLFVAVGAYFVACWMRSGQTLAMKSWRHEVVEADGSRLRFGRAVLRYLLAWHLFVPGLVFIALVRAPSALDGLALLASLVGMLALAYTDPQRQLLHDRLLGTRVLRTAG